MGFLLWIILIILAIVFVIQIVLFVIWIRGNLDLSHFFSRKTAGLFFVPILGVFAFLWGAARARIAEDFGG